MIQVFFIMLIFALVATGFLFLGGHVMKVFQRFSDNTEEKNVHKNIGTLLDNSVSLFINVFVGLLFSSLFYLLIHSIYSFYEADKYNVDYSYAWNYLGIDISWQTSIVFLIGIFGGIVYFIRKKKED